MPQQDRAPTAQPCPCGTECADAERRARVVAAAIASADLFYEYEKAGGLGLYRSPH